MSQVIITDDSLRAKRGKSRDQENKITRDAVFSHYRRSDITGKDPVAMLIGVAVLPVLGLWSILVAIMTLILKVVSAVFRGLGVMLGGKRNLIRE